MRSPLALVFFKETREMFRDKRVRASAFFWPIAVIVLFLYLFGFVANTLSKPENLKVHLVGSGGELGKRLRDAKLNVLSVPSMQEGERLIRLGKARLVLELPEEWLRDNGERSVNVAAAFDPSDTKSQITLRAVKELFREVNVGVVKRLLAERGVPEELAEAVHVEERPVKVGESANDFVVGMLPYLIVIWAFYGGMSIVSDLVAGEKEKTTLETLLIAPIKRSDIALGKFLALSVVCLISSLSSLIGLWIVGFLNLPVTRTLLENGLGVSLPAFGVILLVLLPTVALFASTLLAISTYARNVREAQTLTTLVSFIVILPAVFSQFIGFTDFASARWVSLIPVLNAANGIRNALLGKYDGVGLAITVAVSVGIAAVSIAVAVRMFKREEVLVRV